MVQSASWRIKPASRRTYKKGEAQRVINDVLVANAGAIKKLNGEVTKVQEENTNENA